MILHFLQMIAHLAKARRAAGMRFLPLMATLVVVESDESLMQLLLCQAALHRCRRPFAQHWMDDLYVLGHADERSRNASVLIAIWLPCICRMATSYSARMNPDHAQRQSRSVGSGHTSDVNTS